MAIPSQHDVEQAFNDSPYSPKERVAELKAPQRELPLALQLQDEANDRLTKAVEVLHERTSSLRSSHVERGEEDRVARDFGSETARTISDQANRTNLAAQVVEKILQELEI